LDKLRTPIVFLRGFCSPYQQRRFAVGASEKTWCDYRVSKPNQESEHGDNEHPFRPGRHDLF
jgi:hypothetical protein